MIAVGFALLFAAPTSAHPNHLPSKCGEQATASADFVSVVWAPERWRRGQPKDATLAAWHSKVRCLGPGARHLWREAQRDYYRHRSAMLFRQRVTPFYCGSSEMTFDAGWYAIPCGNVNAESGGRGGWTCNTYGIIGGLDEPGASSATWVIYGGTKFAPTACAASEHDQSIVASRIYHAVGTAAWTPFE